MRIPVPGEARRSALRTVLPIGGVIIFSPLLLVVFDRMVLVSGVPLLVVYLFGAWLVGIALTAWLAGSGRTGTAPPPEPAGAAPDPVRVETGPAPGPPQTITTDGA